jgi:hypothetical protein
MHRHSPGYSERDDSAPPDQFYAPAGGMYMPRWHNLNRTTDPQFETGFAVQGAMGRMRSPRTRPRASG